VPAGNNRPVPPFPVDTEREKGVKAAAGCGPAPFSIKKIRSFYADIIQLIPIVCA
jgi:hypothetical protein